MSMPEHLDSLRSKHERLEQMIDDEMHRPLPEQTELMRLKREKLKIKEELEQPTHDEMPKRDGVDMTGYADSA